MEQYDGSRLTEFRQLKAEIRGSREYLAVDIDIAKERHHAFFGTAMGKPFSSGSSSTTPKKASRRSASTQTR